MPQCLQLPQEQLIDKPQGVAVQGVHHIVTPARHLFDKAAVWVMMLSVLYVTT